MSTSRRVAWTIWVVASLFYAYQYILRVMPNIFLDDIMQQFRISTTTFGQFSGIYYIGYSLMHLPIGILLDRYGARKVMSGSILLTVVGLSPLLFASHWIYPIIGRAFIGMGSSAAILGVFKIVRMTFSKARFSRMLSLSVTIGLMGAIYGGGPVSYMHQIFGYQTVVQLFAWGGIALACVTYWIIPPEPSDGNTPVISNIKEVLGNYRVLSCCFFAGMMVGPLEGFADVWGTPFLKQVYGFDGALAAGLSSMIFVGMCFGAPALSLIAEKVGSSLATIIGAGFAMAGSFFLMLFWQLTAGALSSSFVLIGICCAYQILAIYQASTYVREQVAGLATAVANMIIMLFGYAFHATIGSTIHAMGGSGNPQAVLYGVAIIPIGLFLGTAGFIILFAIDKSHKGAATLLDAQKTE